MDKHTLSNYGWIVIATILISIFIILAFIVGDVVVDSTVNMFPPEETKSTGNANVTISKSISVTVGDSYEKITKIYVHIDSRVFCHNREFFTI